MSNSKQPNLVLKGEPEEVENQNIIQPPVPYVDEERNVKHESEIHLLGVLLQPWIILKKIKIEEDEEGQSEPKSSENEGQDQDQKQTMVQDKNLAQTKVQDQDQHQGQSKPKKTQARDQKGQTRAKKSKYHMTTHDRKPETYTCDICSRNFQKPVALAAHRTVHQEWNLKCPKCDKVFNRNANLGTHLRIHMRPEMFECAVCDKKFKQKGHLQAHLRTHQADRSLYSCDFCEAKFRNKSTLIFHISSKHLEVESKFICDICSKSFNNKRSIRNHMDHHVTEFCKICGKKYSKKVMNTHMREFHRNDNLKCPQCEKIFKVKSYLRRHMETHEKKFKCKICDRPFSRNMYLTDHMKWHENTSVFRCEKCKNTFRTKQALQYHQRSKNRKSVGCQWMRYFCDKCGFSSTAKPAIVNHLKCHLDL